MGLFTNVFKKAYTSADLAREIQAGRKTKSGESVTVATAIDVSTVFACCRVIGEGVAQVPLQLMRESSDGRIREKATDHSLYGKMAHKPNRWMTSFEYRELIAWHVVLTGNHYSFISRAGKKILELYPFNPDSVIVNFDHGVLSYKVTGEDGSERTFPQESILHVRGPSMSGWYGLDAVRHAREAIGLAIATESAVAGLHKNGIRPAGTYSVEGTLNRESFASLRKWIDDHYAGAENAGKTLILDRSAKWVNTTMSGIDAQTLEQRAFQIQEICRFARVMPIMVGHSDKAATYASAEQMFLAHLTHTITPWFVRLEQCFNANLLTERERAEGLYFNFVEEGLLRGSAIDTKETILGYVNAGIISANEARALLDRNPDPDPASDTLRIPANITGNAQASSPDNTLNEAA